MWYTCYCVYLTRARSSTWVFDTGSVAHICNSKQGLRIKRRLAKDEVTMRVGNGSKVDVITVGTLPLHLPLGLILDPNNCYLVPALSMNIISKSCLMWDGYSFKSENNGYSTWVISFMVMHPERVVYFCWISIVVIHISTILMPKYAKLLIIVQHICGTAV